MSMSLIKRCPPGGLVWGLGKTSNVWDAINWTQSWSSEQSRFPTHAANRPFTMSVTKVKAKVAPTDVEYAGTPAGDTPSFDAGFPELMTEAALFQVEGEPYTGDNEINDTWQFTLAFYAMRHCVGSRAVYVGGEQKYVDYLIAANGNNRLFRYVARVNVADETVETFHLNGDVLFDDSDDPGRQQPFVEPFNMKWGVFGQPSAPTDLTTSGSKGPMIPDRWACTSKFMFWSSYSIKAEEIDTYHTVARFKYETREFEKYYAWQYFEGDPDHPNVAAYKFLKLPSRRAFQQDEDDQGWWIAGDMVNGLVTGKWDWSKKRAYFAPGEFENNLGLPLALNEELTLSNQAIVLFYQHQNGKDLVIVGDGDGGGTGAVYIYDGTRWWHESEILVQDLLDEDQIPAHGEEDHVHIPTVQFPTYLTFDHEGNFLIGNPYWVHKYDRDWNFLHSLYRMQPPPAPPEDDLDTLPGEIQEDPIDNPDWSPDQADIDSNGYAYAESNSWVPQNYRYFQIVCNKSEIQLRSFRSYIDLASKTVDIDGNDGRRYYFLKFRYHNYPHELDVFKRPMVVLNWSLSHDFAVKVPHVQYVTLPPSYNLFDIQFNQLFPPGPGDPFDWPRRSLNAHLRPIVSRVYTNFDPTEWEFQPNGSSVVDFIWEDNKVPWLKHFVFMNYWANSYEPKYGSHFLYTWDNYGLWWKKYTGPTYSTDPNDYLLSGVKAPITNLFMSTDWEIVDNSCECGAQLKPY